MSGRTLVARQEYRRALSGLIGKNRLRAGVSGNAELERYLSASTETDTPDSPYSSFLWNRSALAVRIPTPNTTNAVTCGHRTEIPEPLRKIPLVISRK